MNENVVVPTETSYGIGLLCMAAILATKRTKDLPCSTSCGIWNKGCIRAVDRELARQYPSDYPASAEFYSILDRIAEGNAP